MAKGRNSTSRTIRLPDQMYDRIVQLAKVNGMSVNEYINRVLWNQIMRKR